jgi:2-hydroxy-3-keto-5-methylthiopentenyl-1-phosphate phosphatase
VEEMHADVDEMIADVEEDRNTHISIDEHIKMLLDEVPEEEQRAIVLSCVREYLNEEGAEDE